MNLRRAVTYNRKRRFPKDTWRKIQEAIGATPDGIPGKGTARALAMYQARVGLQSDGLFGPGTQAHFAGEWAEVRALTRVEAEALMEPTARHESGRRGYAAHNRDLEYRGRWDRKDKPHLYSHRGERPTHVGSSLWRVQCSQLSGNVGLGVERAREYAEAWGLLGEWHEAWEGRGDAYLDVVTASTSPRRIHRRLESERFEAPGARAPCVMPIDGYDSWDGRGPWPDRLERVSQYEWMQRAADDIAYEVFFLKMLPEALSRGLMNGGELAMLFDASINHGMGGLRRRLRKAGAGADIREIARVDFRADEDGGGKKFRRRLSALDKGPWWVTYTYEEAA